MEFYLDNDEALVWYQEAQSEVMIWLEAPSGGTTVVTGGDSPPQTAVDRNIFTFATATPHGFPVLRVVTQVGGVWQLADKDGPQDIFVVVAVPDPTHFSVGLGGWFRLPAHGLGTVPANLYLGDNGLMTLTPPPITPTASTDPRTQLAIATVLDAETIWINPERRAW
jgi:hypothetical protein